MRQNAMRWTRGASALQRWQTETATKGPLGLKESNRQRLTKDIYRTWVQPDAMMGQQPGPAVVHESSLGARVSAVQNASMSELIEKYIDGRRNAYLALGWKRFKQGKYREAVDIFSLADAVCHGEPQKRAQANKNRAEVRLGMLHAAVASGQYAQAMTLLGWLLTRDSQTGQFPDSLFLTRIADMAERYGRLADYERHVAIADSFGGQEAGAAAGAMALRSVVLWFNKKDPGARTNAIFFAQRLNSPEVGEPWENLYPLMLQATAVRADQSATAKDDVSLSVPTRLPWEEPEEDDEAATSGPS